MPQQRNPQFVLLPILATLWGFFAVIILCLVIVFVSSLGKATGAIQEAACGAIFSTFIIACYVAMRAIDKIGTLILPLLKSNRYREDN